MRFMRPRPPTVGAYERVGGGEAFITNVSLTTLPSSLLSRLRNHNQVDIDVLDARWREREGEEGDGVLSQSGGAADVTSQRMAS